MRPVVLCSIEKGVDVVNPNHGASVTVHPLSVHLQLHYYQFQDQEIHIIHLQNNANP